MPESKLTDQLKISIKDRFPRKTDQMPHKIYKDKDKKSGQSKCYCSHDWFYIFQFIGYSKSEAGLFCVACVLFPMPAHSNSKAKGLISYPYNDWKHGSEDLKGQSILQYHKDSTARFKSFLTSMKNIESRTENRVNKASEDTIKQN